MARRRRPILPVVIAIAILAAYNGRSTAAGLGDMLPDDVSKAGVLRIAATKTFPPFTFTDDAGKFTGIDVEILTEVAKRLGLKAEFTPTDYPTILPGLL